MIQSSLNDWGYYLPLLHLSVRYQMEVTVTTTDVTVPVLIVDAISL